MEANYTAHGNITAVNSSKVKNIQSNTCTAIASPDHVESLSVNENQTTVCEHFDDQIAS